MAEESIKSEIEQIKIQINEINKSFILLKESVALNSVNSLTGEKYNKEEIDELLKKDADAQKILENYHIEAVKKEQNLQKAIEQKKNLVAGPVNYNDYEKMITETENNSIAVSYIKQEIIDICKKMFSTLSILSHISQKEHAAKIAKNECENKDKELEKELNEMRDQIFKEKRSYALLKDKNEDQQHKFVLLQHPRLIDDYKYVDEENKKAQEEVSRLKEEYTNLMNIVKENY